MLHQFLSANREPLIETCRSKAAQRHSRQPGEKEQHFGIPLFLDYLIRTLRDDATAQGSTQPGAGDSATRHGCELLYNGFTVEQVVHDYGDLCQAITGLAIEVEAPIRTEEFRVLNSCLDEAIAGAVMEFTHRREIDIADQEVQNLNERVGRLSHELRDQLNTVFLAVAAIRTGRVGLSGATGAVLDRGLNGLRTLIDRSLADVRVTAGMPPRRALLSVPDFIADIKASAGLEAKARQCNLSVVVDDTALAVEADRDMLLSAVGNLLQNAMKFTHAHSEVVLRAYAQGDNVLIEVQDHCGGLGPGDPEKLFIPFTQTGRNRTGMGLGLAICRRGVEANGGTLTVRDLPGSGCIFTISLPRAVAGAVA